MPTAGKIFYHLEDTTIEQIHEALKGYDSEETVEEGTINLDLRTNIANLGLLDNGDLQGIWKQDGVTSVTHRGKTSYHLYTIDHPFLFTKIKDITYLIIIGKKKLANEVALKFSEILWGDMTHIFEPRMNPGALHGYYKGSDGTKVILFEDLDTPNLDKWTGYGEDVAQTTLHGRFVNVGRVKWVVLKSLKKGYTVGIGSDCGVTLFNNVNTENFHEYMKDEIIPLCLTRSDKEWITA